MFLLLGPKQFGNSNTPYQIKTKQFDNNLCKIKKNSNIVISGGVLPQSRNYKKNISFIKK